MTVEAPPWAFGLHRCGLCYKGILNDLHTGTSLKSDSDNIWDQNFQVLETGELNKENHGVVEDSNVQKS